MYCHGSYLMKYSTEICTVIERTLHLKCREGYSLSGFILRNFLSSLNSTISTEYRSFSYDWSKPFTELLPIRVSIIIYKINYLLSVFLLIELKIYLQ